MRTIAVAPPGVDLPDDLDGTVVDGVESLRQRIVQAIKFRVREWFVDIRRGVDYAMIFGHATTLDLAAATITATIRKEGGDEITSIDVTFTGLDPETRRMTYQATLHTIYGDMELSEALP